jgi:predicted nuclease of predicted toxin-antitoxin system
VQGLLARHGRHRLPIPDLIIAAAAEASDLVVLHYDADFDRIVATTGQPHAWTTAVDAATALRLVLPRPPGPGSHPAAA